MKTLDSPDKTENDRRLKKIYVRKIMIEKQYE